jgi:hypothetical protein
MMFVYGPGTFFVVEDKFRHSSILHDPSYRLMEDGKVAVHLTWLLKGFEHSASYSKTVMMIEAMDWCMEHADRAHLMHRDRNVLFKDPQMATMFKLAMSG